MKSKNINKLENNKFNSLFKSNFSNFSLLLTLNQAQIIITLPKYYNIMYFQCFFFYFFYNFFVNFFFDLNFFL